MSKKAWVAAFGLGLTSLYLSAIDFLVSVRKMLGSGRSASDEGLFFRVFKLPDSSDFLTSDFKPVGFEGGHGHTLNPKP